MFLIADSPPFCFKVSINAAFLISAIFALLWSVDIPTHSAEFSFIYLETALSAL